MTDAALSPLTERAAAPAMLAGVRRTALVEIAAFFVALLAIDFLLLDGTRFRDVVPHPFSLVVLLVAAQYGTNEGLLAAALSTALLLAGNLPPASIEQDMYGYLLGVARWPVLWLAAAVLFGEIRARQLRQALGTRTALAEAEARGAAITEAYRRLAQAKENLEVRVAGQLRTVFTLHRAAKAIEKLGPGEVLLGIADLVRGVMAPQKFSLYLLNNNVLEAVTNEGWTAEDTYTRVFDAGTLLFQNVVGRQRFLASIYPEEERILGGEGIMAGPLISVETGEVVGMLKVEAIGFLDLHLASVENFRILCEWVGTAFANAQRYEAAAEGALMNPERVLLSAGFFDRQTKFLIALARRVGFDVSLVVVRIGAAELREELRLMVAASLAEAVTSQLRTTDLAFDYQRSGWEYAVVLPNTPFPNAQIAADKLVKTIRDRLPAAAAGIELSASLQSLYQHVPREPDASR